MDRHGTSAPRFFSQVTYIAFVNLSEEGRLVNRADGDRLEKGRQGCGMFSSVVNRAFRTTSGNR